MKQSTAPAQTQVGRGKAFTLIMLTVLAVAYAVNAMDRQVYPLLLPAINKQLGFSLQQGGFLSTIFSLGIGISGIFGSYLLIRFPRKNVIVVGTVIFSVFTLLTAVSMGLPDMALYRFASGIGEGMQNVAIYTAMGSLFPAFRTTGLGALSVAYGVGSFLGPNLGATLLVERGWQAPLVVFSVVGFIFAAIIVVFVPRAFTDRSDGVLTPDMDGPVGAPARLWNRNVMIVVALGIVIGLVEYGYIGLYATFLIQHLHFNPKSTGFAFSMFGLGALVAGVPVGYLGDRFRQKHILLMGFICSALVSFVMFNVATLPWEQFVLSFFEGVFTACWIYVNGYSLMQRSVAPALSGAASGIYIAAMFIPASGAGYLFATLVGGVGWGGAAVIQLVLLPLVGIIVALFINERELLPRVTHG